MRRASIKEGENYGGRELRILRRERIVGERIEGERIAASPFV